MGVVLTLFLIGLKERFGIDAALCREDGQDDGKDNNSDDGDNERDETDDEHTPTGNRLSKGSSKAIPAVVVGEKYHYSSLAAGHDEVPASAKNLEKVWDDEALACVKAIGNKAAQSGIKVEDDDNVNGEDEVLPSISSTPAKASDDDDDDPSCKFLSTVFFGVFSFGMEKTTANLFFGTNSHQPSRCRPQG